MAKEGYSYPNARWATAEELETFYPIAGARNGGLLLGTLEIPAKERNEHCLVLGPTGGGKGITVMVPTLIRDMLSSSSSVYADIKSPEMFEFLSRVHDSLKKSIPGYDRLFLGFCPFELSNTVCWNPIDKIRTFGEAQTWTEICLNNSSARAVTTTSAGAEHYALQQRRLLRSLLLFVNNTIWREKQRNNLATVLRLLDLRHDPESGVLELLQKLKNTRYQIEDEGHNQLVPVWQIIKSDLMEFFACDPQEVNDAKSSLKERLALFRDPRVALATSKTELPLQQLGLEPITLVLGVPKKEKKKAKLLTALFLEGLVKELNELAADSPGQKCPVSVSILLDEAGSLGRYDLPEWFGNVRSAGIGFIAVFQSIAQIQEVFGREGALILLDNARTQVYLSGCGTETAKYAAEKAGKHLVRSEMESRSSSGGAAKGSTITKTRSTQQQIYELIPAHAIERLEIDGKPGVRYQRNFLGQLQKRDGHPVIEAVRALVFTARCSPSLAYLPAWYTDRQMVRWAEQGQLTSLRAPGGPLEVLDSSTLHWALTEDDVVRGAPSVAEPDAQPPGAEVPAGGQESARHLRALPGPGEKATRRAGKADKKVTPPGPEASELGQAPTVGEGNCPHCGLSGTLQKAFDVQSGVWEYRCSLNSKHVFSDLKADAI